MRVPIKEMPLDVTTLSSILNEQIRVVGLGENKVAVLRKDQIPKIKAITEAFEKANNTKLTRLNESSAVAQRAFAAIMNYGSSAKSTPAGRMALASAILSLSSVDPGLATGLSYLLD